MTEEEGKRAERAIKNEEGRFRNEATKSQREEWSDWEKRSGSRRTVRVTASDSGSERVSIRKEDRRK
jgi:hypothetical protein